MLSVTNSIADVKILLRQPFTFYDFPTEIAFDNEIKRLLDQDAGFLWLRALIGDALYDDIALKDSVFDILDNRDEQLIYFSENHLGASIFLENQASEEQQQLIGNIASESIRSQGYSESVSYGRTGSNGKAIKAGEHFTKALDFLDEANMNPYQMQRGGGIAKDTKNRIFQGFF